MVVKTQAFELAGLKTLNLVFLIMKDPKRFEISLDKLFNSAQEGKHECTSFRQGDWVIFHCPQCSDYERRLNWKTGEMTIEGDSYILHQGLNQPTGIDLKRLNAN